MKRLFFSRVLLAFALLAFLSGCAGISKRNLPEPVAEVGDTSVFGLVMLKPFGGMSECKSLMGEYNQARSRGERCFERADAKLMGTSKPLGTETVYVLLPLSEQQQLSFVVRGLLQVQLIHGVVHSVAVQTGGVRTQINDFAEVRSKFGKPDNGFETEVSGVKAMNGTWQRPRNVQVTFNGAVDHPGMGFIRIQSHTWLALEKLRDATAKKPMDA